MQYWLCRLECIELYGTPTLCIWGVGYDPRHGAKSILFCFCHARYSLRCVVTTLYLALVLFGFAFAVAFKARRRRNAFRLGLLLLSYP
jgi:hypothetical protein